MPLMPSTTFSYLGLSAKQADDLAEAYFVLDRDFVRIGEHFEISSNLAKRLLLHPLTRAAIRRKAREMAGILYSREEHLRMLKKIRDAAFNDDNFKTALSAEVAVGKAAGLYENLGPEDPDNGAALPDPASLTTEQLRAQLQARLALPGPAQGDEHLMSSLDREKALSRLEDEDGDEGAF